MSLTPTSPSATRRNPFCRFRPGHTRQMAMLTATIIIGDMNAAPMTADHRGQTTPQDHAVRDTINMLVLLDLSADLEGQPSHFSNQTAPSRIEVCYGPTTIIRAEARYGLLLLGPIGHRPLNLCLSIPNLSPNPPQEAHQVLPPLLKMRPLHDKQAWSKYHRGIDQAGRNKQDPTDLLTSMRTAAVACGLQQQPQTGDDQPPGALGDIVNALWQGKKHLATLLRTDNPQTRRHLHWCRTQIAHIRADVQQWHIHRQQHIAQEH